MQIDSESLLVNTLSDSPEVAPPSSVVVIEVVIGVRGSNANRKLPATHSAPPSALLLCISAELSFHASIVAKCLLMGITISCSPSFRNEDPPSRSASVDDFLAAVCRALFSSVFLCFVMAQCFYRCCHWPSGPGNAKTRIPIRNAGSYKSGGDLLSAFTAAHPTR